MQVFVDEAGRALEEIERVGQELLAAIESLATEATEESGVANRVSRDMDDLRRAARQSGLGASQVAAVLGNIRRDTGETRQGRGRIPAARTEPAAPTAVPCTPRPHPRLRNPLK